jgi:hypothetical protein
MSVMQALMGVAAGDRRKWQSICSFMRDFAAVQFAIAVGRNERYADVVSESPVRADYPGGWQGSARITSSFLSRRKPCVPSNWRVAAMGMTKAVLTEAEDVYVDYDYEGVMFRCDAGSRSIFRKFYGEAEHPLPIDHTNKLFNDALRFGERSRKEKYDSVGCA